MIRSESEYQEATKRIRQEEERLSQQRAKLREMDLSRAEIKRAMDPVRSFHEQLKEEVASYERLRRGEFEELHNFQGAGQLLVALRISQGKLLETQKKIAEDQRVVAVYDITGEWDSLVIGYFKDRQDLNDFIKNLLSQRNVDRSVTHIVLNVVKEERRILV